MKKLVLSLLVLVAIFSVGANAQNTINNSFFDQVDYVGAFGTTDWTSGWANFDPQTTVYPATTVTIPNGNLSTQTWTSGNVYLLNGWVRVPNGVTLTIQPGTIIRGDYANQGALIVERGGTLIADGTAANPIVFTSNQAPGSRAAGDWGGIIVLGYATINVPGGTAIIEGGVGSTFGGTNDADNSGILKYVRIEFPGIAFSPNNEINGLTMGGVGSGTTLDYIQVSYSGDDSFEWFGGTVNAKHLIAFRGMDDDFDCDFGYRGMIQYGVILRDPAAADAAGDSNGFEVDNDGSGSSNTPITQPVFSNVSVFGPQATPSTTISTYYARSMYLRRNNKIDIFNSILTAWKFGLRIKDSSTELNATNNELRIENCIMAGMNDWFETPFSGSYFMAPSRNNDTLTNNSDLMITNPYNLTAPNFMPLSGSPVFNASYWGTNYSISGNVTYDNASQTVLNGCTVELLSGSTVLFTTTTDGSGNFLFDAVPDGTYSVRASTTRAWGGVNIIDVVIARKYAATLQTLTPFKVMAGDVTEDGVLNILDALMIQRKIATLTTPAWTADNWVFEMPSVTVAGANVTANIKGSVSGDVHGNATPPAN
ncbi:MAG: hypothetical protein K9H64_07885 [Bacteroidales bacterium]|nr:hypothetical protein [Bacteroidales bacterium]MCF8455737.1 hypothetical protein [Bacteroidales bacterium]